MNFLATIAVTCATFTSMTSASPLLEARQSTPDRFILQTQVIPGGSDCGSNKDGLYLFSYHTGAGLGIAAAEEHLPDTQAWFSLQDTNLTWTYEGSPGPWPVEIEYGPYQSFNPISISIASQGPTPGFFINSTGLQSNASTGGWLACDWWYLSPQIFSVPDPNDNVPNSCSKINLIPVAL